jgi:hypothetical protein
MDGHPVVEDVSVEDALRPFGWRCGPEFDKRYASDRWVFNLANAVQRLTNENVRLRKELDEAQLRSIEARNPGIDMDEVRRSRAEHSDREQHHG